MGPGSEATTLVPGLSTGIGSLPYHDATIAARRSLEYSPLLPAVPQLPNRDARELMLPQWLVALPEVSCADDGSITLRDHIVDADAAPVVDFLPEYHLGLLTFMQVARRAAEPPSRVKLQLTGPLTLGLALIEAGMSADVAFRRAADAVRAWIPALEGLVARELPGTKILLFLDEPGLVAWSDDDGPLEHEAAVDILSGALARATGATGVHVCGPGNVRIALEAGPRVLGVEAGAWAVREAAPLVRHLDAGGWIAWGAVPTDRPVGEIVDPLWKNLAAVWCEFARRGADPVALRSRALITPACGLGRHGESQAERALTLAHDLAARVHDQAIAARLTLGA